MEIKPYNPLDKRNLGGSVAEALPACSVRPLGDLETFAGAGIYAIYYTGNFKAYKPLALKNCGGRFQTPIYVCKAVPPGAGEKVISVLMRSLAPLYITDCGNTPKALT